jgi:hypothetical protein
MECEFGELTAARRKGIKFIIDIADYENFIKNYSFCLNTDGYVVYSSRKDGLHGKRLHRVIMGEPDDREVDHINVNPLDNRRENLRVCTNQQNLFNKNKYSNNTSGFKGVSFHKNAQKFVASISIDGKLKHLGYFATAAAAHEEYKIAAVKYHGEFAHF